MRQTITVDGFTLNAPGFTPDSFDRAIKRAHDEGLKLTTTGTPYQVAVSSGSHPGRRYLVTRQSCTCQAGQRGLGCKHRAYAIFLADVVRKSRQTAA